MCDKRCRLVMEAMVCGLYLYSCSSEKHSRAHGVSLLHGQGPAPPVTPHLPSLPASSAREAGVKAVSQRALCLLVPEASLCIDGGSGLAFPEDTTHLSCLQGALVYWQNRHRPRREYGSLQDADTPSCIKVTRLANAHKPTSSSFSSGRIYRAPGTAVVRMIMTVAVVARESAPTPGQGLPLS